MLYGFTFRCYICHNYIEMNLENGYISLPYHVRQDPCMAALKKNNGILYYFPLFRFRCCKQLFTKMMGDVTGYGTERDNDHRT